MATWQFDLFLVPRGSVDRTFGSIPAKITRDRFDDIDWWGESEVALGELRTSLSSVLPSAPSWSPDVEIWGTDDGNRIDLLLDGARVAEVYLRVDVRQLPNAFLNSVVKLAQRFDCLWVTADDMQVLEPGVRALAATIQNSEAARFVADPELFLDELSADES